MKLFIKHNKNKGFTLVEVSVSLVVFAIMATVAGAIILVSGNIFAKNAMLSSAQISCNNLYSTISDKISYANKVSISKNSAIPTGFEKSYNEQLTIYKDIQLVTLQRFGIDTVPVNLCEKDELGTLFASVTFDFTDFQNGKSYIGLTVDLYDSNESDSEIVFTKSGIIPLLNYSDENAGNFIFTAENSDSDLYITYTYLR